MLFPPIMGISRRQGCVGPQNHDQGRRTIKHCLQVLYSKVALAFGTHCCRYSAMVLCWKPPHPTRHDKRREISTGGCGQCGLDIAMTSGFGSAAACTANPLPKTPGSVGPLMTHFRCCFTSTGTLCCEFLLHGCCFPVAPFLSKANTEIDWLPHSSIVVSLRLWCLFVLCIVFFGFNRQCSTAEPGASPPPPPNSTAEPGCGSGALP